MAPASEFQAWTSSSTSSPRKNATITRTLRQRRQLVRLYRDPAAFRGTETFSSNASRKQLALFDHGSLWFRGHVFGFTKDATAHVSTSLACEFPGCPSVGVRFDSLIVPGHAIHTRWVARLAALHFHVYLRVTLFLMFFFSSRPLLVLPSPVTCRVLRSSIVHCVYTRADRRCASVGTCHRASYAAWTLTNKLSQLSVSTGSVIANYVSAPMTTQRMVEKHFSASVQLTCVGTQISRSKLPVCLTIFAFHSRRCTVSVHNGRYSGHLQPIKSPVLLLWSPHSRAFSAASISTSR